MKLGTANGSGRIAAGSGVARRPATLAEVARLAGVSTAAASLAIREPQGRRRVSRASQRRIKEVASRLNYRPNPAARTLALSRTHQIGLYLNSPNSLNLSLTPWREVLTRIQSRLGKAGYRLGIYYFPPGRETGFSDFLIPNRFVDGLLVQGRDLSPGEIQKIREAGMPVISLYEDIPGMHSLTIDEERMGSDAADYLYGMGHRRIALLAMTAQRPGWNGRITGFLRRAEELGIGLPASRQCIEPVGDRLAGSLELPRELFRKFSRIRGSVTALYCPSDYLSFALLKALDKQGIEVGRDLSLLSYDNLEGMGFRPWSVARLTSFSPPFARIAERVMDLFDHLDAFPSPTHHVFAPRIVERGSVAKI